MRRSRVLIYALLLLTNRFSLVLASAQKAMPSILIWCFQSLKFDVFFFMRFTFVRGQNLEHLSDHRDRERWPLWEGTILAIPVVLQLKIFLADLFKTVPIQFCFYISTQACEGMCSWARSLSQNILSCKIQLACVGMHKRPSSQGKVGLSCQISAAPDS